MTEKKLTNISFVSYLKIFLAVSFVSGIILGIIGFFGSVVGGNTYLNLGFINVTGIVAGTANLFLFPITISFGGLIVCLLSFLPFKLFLKLIKGIKLTMELE